MATNPQRGDLFLARICKALKINRPVQRIVIDIPVDGIVTLYVQEVFEEHDGEETVDAIFRDLAESIKVKQVEPDALVNIDEFGRVQVSRKS